MEKPKRLDLQSADGVQLNLDALYQIAPSCFTEAADPNTGGVKRVVNFDVLRQLLGDDAVEDAPEAYEFNWVGKQAARAEVLRPINKTLRPVKEDSVDWDTTQNLYIEGDNLEVLKLLQKSYLGKVKMIYIDPPYNTGNDFVYHDVFARSQKEENLAAGNVDELGNRFIKNTDSNGRYHSDWCSMIYSRLMIARSLLTEDGVIFISIDDNEVENLRKICDEVFGENNFVATYPWRKRTAKSDVPFGVSQDFEWIVVFAKSDKFRASIEGKERKYYTTEDYPNKPWRIHDLTKQTTASERPKSFFTIVDPKNGTKYPANPNRTWCITEDTISDYMKEGRIVFPGDYDFLKISKPVLRYWKQDDETKAGDNFGRVSVSTKLDDTIGMSQDGTKELTALFNGKIFSFPKPSKLIKYLLSIINDSNALVLDFFSGSATTAHAVMQLNAEDGGNRKFIMVQLPEETTEDSEAYKAGYKNICEIGKERIRRAGRKIKEDAGLTAPADLDIGFRCLRLDESNMQQVYYTPDAVTQQDLFSMVDNVKPDRTPEDLLFQVMLDLGVLLSSTIEVKEIAGKKVFNVADGFLLACFDHDVTDETVKAIAQMKPYYAVFRDSSMASDSVATNFDQIFETYSPDTVRKVL